MLLPDKYVTVERSLLGQAALILRRRTSDQTISELWASLVSSDHDWTFERFALALTLLFGLGAVRLRNGILDWATP